MNRPLTCLTLPLLFCIAHASYAQQQMTITAGSQPPYNDLPELIRQHLTGAEWYCDDW